jgi:hypothetical protein
MFYTFRQIDTAVYEVTKWETFRTHPLDTYTIEWRKGVLSAHMCDCPARVPCRHLKMLKDAIDRGKMNEPWTWIFTDEWERVHDQDVCVYRELVE